MADKIEKHEVDTVETLAHAYGLAQDLFGDKASHVAAEEIYDYLAVAEDPEDLMADLRRVIEHTKIIYKTDAPTPEQVFGVFERIFGEE